MPAAGFLTPGFSALLIRELGVDGMSASSAPTLLEAGQQRPCAHFDTLGPAFLQQVVLQFDRARAVFTLRGSVKNRRSMALLRKIEQNVSNMSCCE